MAKALAPSVERKREPIVALAPAMPVLEVLDQVTPIGDHRRPAGSARARVAQELARRSEQAVEKRQPPAVTGVEDALDEPHRLLLRARAGAVAR